MLFKPLKTEEAPHTTARGFELLLAEPNGFRVHLLSRSDTLSCLIKETVAFQTLKNRGSIPHGQPGVFADACAVARARHHVRATTPAPILRTRSGLATHAGHSAVASRSSAHRLGAATAKGFPVDLESVVQPGRQVTRARAQFRSLCGGGSPESLWQRQRGDSNPCGQSPMDFESISLAARTHCLA